MSRVALILASALALSACATARHHTPCSRFEQFAVHELLYFGTGKPDGVVTSDEWSEFLKAVVTPRFPQGLTVLEASGQWRGADGVIVREASYVVSLLHPSDPSSEKAVLEIVAAYKSQFHQEAVLRVRSHACTSF